jgi:hypothetical protein
MLCIGHIGMYMYLDETHKVVNIHTQHIRVEKYLFMQDGLAAWGVHL